jgi:hypothetical protein
MNADPDDRLRRALDDPPLADDGFTARVMAALPPPRRRSPRLAVLAGALVLALLMLVFLPVAPNLREVLAQLLSARSLPLSTLIAALALLAATVGASVYAATPE